MLMLSCRSSLSVVTSFVSSGWPPRAWTARLWSERWRQACWVDVLGWAGRWGIVALSLAVCIWRDWGFTSDWVIGKSNKCPTRHYEVVTTVDVTVHTMGGRVGFLYSALLCSVRGGQMLPPPAAASPSRGTARVRASGSREWRRRNSAEEIRPDF